MHISGICAKISIAIVGLLFLLLTLTLWLGPHAEYSTSERRKLAAFPTLSTETIADGSFMTGFETWTQDHFPMRDSFRTLKSLFLYYGLGQIDNNGIYLRDGYAAQVEYPLDKASLTHATDRFRYLYDNCLAGTDAKVYLSIVPDKSYFGAENGILHMDYDTLFATVQSQMPYARYIDITGTLDVTDYYKTDTHWRQEKLTDTAQTLAAGMGVTLTETYTENVLPDPFYGVYYGQSALPLPGEELRYLTNDLLSSCTVTNHENGTVGGIYDMDKAAGRDPYELFLSGSVSFLTIDNPHAKTDRELVVFRDSFGSSIMPLLVEGYSKVTLVDIRYLRPEFVSRFVTFDDQDVLFLYSTLILNNSETIM